MVPQTTNQLPAFFHLAPKKLVEKDPASIQKSKFFHENAFKLNINGNDLASATLCHSSLLLRICFSPKYSDICPQLHDHLYLSSPPENLVAFHVATLRYTSNLRVFKAGIMVRRS